MNTQQTSDLSYEDILNKDILELIGAKDMPEEKKEELYNKMVDTIYNRVISRLIDNLTDTELEEWKITVSSGNNQAMVDFFQVRQINVPQLMTVEALSYKTELVSLSTNINQ